MTLMEHPSTTGLADQKLMALERANHVRTWRAQLKRDIRDGLVDWRDIVRNPPQEAHTMLLLDVLKAARRVGAVSANAALRRAKASPTLTLEQMTDRQRDAVTNGNRLDHVVVGGTALEVEDLRAEIKALRRENQELSRKLTDLQEPRS